MLYSEGEILSLQGLAMRLLRGDDRLHIRHFNLAQAAPDARRAQPQSFTPRAARCRKQRLRPGLGD
jgi:hypothetical protein